MRRQLINLTALAASLVALLTSPGNVGAADSTSKPFWREAAMNVPPAAVPQGTLAPLIKVLKPAVVNISSTTKVKNTQRGIIRPRRGQPGESRDPWEQFFERYFGSPREMPEEQRGTSLGSGFIINADGYILTNNHVVQNAADIRVRLTDNRQFRAKVVGRDELLDVALILLENAPKNLPVVNLGDSDALEQGDFVMAMGSPFDLRESASFGIVSAKDRSGVTGGPYDDFVQTDAAINPGNSGGPLFNMKGEVVGINTAIVSPQIGQGIGFAVPINLAKQVIPQLLANGKVTRGYLGVSVGDLTPDLAQGFGLPADTQGAVVQQVLPKAPAAKAGVQAGDVVVALNGKAIASSGQLTRNIATIAPGGKANLTLLRSGQKKEIAVTVSQRPAEEKLARGEQGGEEENGVEQGASPTGSSKEAKIGLKLSDLTPDVAKELGIQGDKGAVVTEVAPDSSAERAGLQRGDLITEVNRQPVTTPAQVVALVNKAKTGEVVLLRIRRGQAAVFVPVRVEAKPE
jgi:serine protease Do